MTNEGTMTHEGTLPREGAYRAAGFGKAFSEQFRLLWMSRRPLFMMLGIIGFLALFGEPWSERPEARLFAMWPAWLLLAGPVWGFAVWHNEGPSNRLYFWSHPVSRTAHSLGRVAAGAAWLLVLYAGLVLAAAAFAALDGHLAQFGVVGFTAWVALFTGPLLGYLIISALTVSSDHPIRWFLGILLGVPLILSLLDEWLGLQDVLRFILKPLSSEDWGLGVTLVAPVLFAMARVHDVFSDTGAGRPRVGEQLDLASWWLAMPLWVLFWAGVVILLARRHPDVFPRWRRPG